MNNKKLFGRTCPECGEVYQSCEFAKINLGLGAHVNMQCTAGHKWTEFYSLDYRGYWHSGEIYDSYGEQKENKTI